MAKRKRQSKKRDSIRSGLGRRLTLEYLLHVGIFVALFIFWLRVSVDFIWGGGLQGEIWRQIPFEVMEAAAVAIPIALWILHTIRFFRKPLRFLDDLLNASEQLAENRERPIELPRALREAEEELNAVRRRAIYNEKMLRESDEKKNDLIMYLAHDLKTPLTSVIGYLNLLEENPELAPEQRAKYTGIALEKAERLEELIGEFFDITRLTLTTMTLRAEQRSLSRMLEQIVYEFQPIIEERGLSWRTQIEPDVEITCDGDKLQRVFENLIRNAMSYSYPDTTLDLAMKTDKREARIWLRNHGATIPKEKLPRLFEQFYRLDEARPTASGGAGLGLAIAREIVELHGGKISAASENETITFYIALPCDQSARSGKKAESRQVIE